MSHYKPSTSKTSIIEKAVGIAVNKSLLKEYDYSDYSYSSQRNPDGSGFSSASVSVVPTVYMNDGTEFQIMLFNPWSFTIGASVYINDNKISSSYIVLRPGERIWLDRWINSKDKLKFSTYEVSGKSEAVKEAIKNNGNIQINIYKEQIYEPACVKITDSTTFWDAIKPHIGDDHPFDNGVIYSTNAVQSAVQSVVNNGAACTTCAATYADASIYNTSLHTSRCTKDSTIETGRVEHGGKSNQNFQEINGINFEVLPHKTFKFKILPVSQKPVFKNDLKKKYCHNCGRKLKQEFKFCPSCGAKQ